MAGTLFNRIVLRGTYFPETPFASCSSVPLFSKAPKKEPPALTFCSLCMTVLMITLDVVPVLTLWLSSYLRSFDYSQHVLTPFFESKRMTPAQIHLFLTERLWPLRWFGFVCCCLERLPLLGTIFSISNHVGAALLALALEARQHRFARGELRKVPALPPSWKWNEPQYHGAHVRRCISLGVTAEEVPGETLTDKKGTTS